MKKITAANLPHWFPEIRATLILMGGSAARPLISKITENTVTIRYPGKFAYQDSTIIRKLYVLLNKGNLAIKWTATVQGLYLVIGPEEFLEEQTGAQV